MDTDPRIARLREIGDKTRELRHLEAERNRLLCELMRDYPERGMASRLANLADLSRGRVHQIIGKRNGRG